MQFVLNSMRESVKIIQKHFTFINIWMRMRESEIMHTDIELAKVAFWHMVETQEWWKTRGNVDNDIIILCILVLLCQNDDNNTIHTNIYMNIYIIDWNENLLANGGAFSLFYSTNTHSVEVDAKQNTIAL